MPLYDNATIGFVTTQAGSATRSCNRFQCHCTLPTGTSQHEARSAQWYKQRDFLRHVRGQTDGPIALTEGDHRTKVCLLRGGVAYRSAHGVDINKSLSVMRFARYLLCVCHKHVAGKPGCRRQRCYKASCFDLPSWKASVPQTDKFGMMLQ